MKKTLLPLAIILSMVSLAGCNQNNNGGGGEGGGSYTAQDPLDLGPDFKFEYYPKKEQNKVASIIEGASGKMKIDVALNFEGTADAWQVLADEYERLCGGAVDVNIIKNLDTAGYTERLRIEENNAKTDWDIVQGNLMYSAGEHCQNLRQTINTQNPYAGNKIWADFLQNRAYETEVSSSSDTTYLLNTENLSTAWFVNTAATTKAGITNPNPETWEDLIDMLDRLQQAGYKYPLGLSLTKDGIAASQFSWLLRIYGDYYYRQKYALTSKTYDSVTKTDDKFEYDKSAKNIEAFSASYNKFSYSYSRAVCLMLDESTEYYCGPNSDLYKDFLSQFQKIAKYIKPSAYQLSFNEVREAFIAQKNGNNGDEAPQIMLDYSGSGLAFLSADALKNNIDFFDYPMMETTYVEHGTALRRVGGNGGYLAILNYHNRRQTNLNKDFLQFVLSPYGQTIYYKALREKNISPKGLTTVLNDLVVIPEEWVSFFQSNKIKDIEDTGLADNNKFINVGAVSFFANSKVSLKSVDLWQRLLTTNDLSVDQFASEWYYSLLSNWPTVVSEHKGWKEDAYLYSHFVDPSYIAD